MVIRTAATSLAVGIFAAGIVLVVVSVLQPDRPLLFVGLPLCAVGSVWFQLIVRKRRSPRDSLRPRAAGRTNIPVSGTANPVERLMKNHPGRQLAWFLFVAAVATTAGVVGELNTADNDRNLIGGIASFGFAMFALVLAGFAYINWRYPEPPHPQPPRPEPSSGDNPQDGPEGPEVPPARS